MTCRLAVSANFHHGHIVMRSSALKPGEAIAALSPTEAEEFALELLAQSYLLRERNRSRMPPRIRTDLMEVLEPVRD